MYRQGVADEPGKVVPVVTTSTPVVSRREDRVELNVVNDSDTIIYLRLAADGATLNSGIRLNPNGGAYSTQHYFGPISAIHGGTGTKNLLVTEI